MTDLDRLRRKHEGDHWCVASFQQPARWVLARVPCDTAIVLAALDGVSGYASHLEARERRLREALVKCADTYEGEWNEREPEWDAALAKTSEP